MPLVLIASRAATSVFGLESLSQNKWHSEEHQSGRRASSFSLCSDSEYRPLGSLSRYGRDLRRRTVGIRTCDLIGKRLPRCGSCALRGACAAAHHCKRNRVELCRAAKPRHGRGHTASAMRRPGGDRKFYRLFHVRILFRLNRCDHCA